MSLSVIYDRFASQISNLQDAANNIAQANIGLEQRDWRVPESWTASVFEISGLNAPFERSEMDDAFPTFFDSEEGKVADCMATQIQSDYLAMQRRSFGLRHASRIRCAMHAAGRRNGHGNKDGGLFARLTNHLQDIIVSGDA